MQVQHIGNVNENLDHAMSLLKKLFDDKSVFLQYIIQKTFIVDQMVDKTSSLYSGLASIENNWDQINKIKGPEWICTSVVHCRGGSEAISICSEEVGWLFDQE